MRLGLLGGAFNPPHVGHLLLAQEARWQLALDQVLLLPVGRPTHRNLDGDPGGAVRLALCAAAVEGVEGLGVSDTEVVRDEPSTTVGTLRTIHAQRPEDELTFILGGDAAAGLPTWREPAEVVRLARLAVAERSGVKRADVLARIAEIPGGEDADVAFVDLPRIDVSSSLVRARVRAGRPLRWLVPDPVAAEIDRRRLYAGGR